MKKYLFTILALAITFSTFATSETSTLPFVKMIKENFENASNIEVSVKRDFTKVTFVHNSKRMEAFYNSQSELIGTAQAVDIATLPTSAKRTFAKKFEGFVVTEAIAFEGTEEHAYFLTAKKDNENIILKISNNGQLSIYKKN